MDNNTIGVSLIVLPWLTLAGIIALIAWAKGEL